MIKREEMERNKDGRTEGKMVRWRAGGLCLTAALLSTGLSACQSAGDSGRREAASQYVEAGEAGPAASEGAEASSDDRSEEGASSGTSAPRKTGAGLSGENLGVGDSTLLSEDGQGDGQEVASLIQPQGATQQERIRTPEGYTRVQEPEGSFGEFLRKYPLEEDGARVLLYDGREKGNQSAHAAVYSLPVIDRADVQQCADSVMRMYAEYYYATGQADKIAFHFVDGFLFDYASYRDGRRVSVGENRSSWTDGGSYDDSYERFEDYLYITFAYSSTLSMEEECSPAELGGVRAGDVFLHGGSPGHVVMVVDVCENGEGERAFLLAQGYMPAQQFHILKNPAHEEDPWYYVEEVEYPFHTPEYTFEEGSFRRPQY